MRLRYLLFSFVTLAPPSTLVTAQDDRTCGTSATKQADYRGDIAVTTNGRTCQAWTSQTPHSHGNTPEARSDMGLEGGHNHCRNPDGENRAWCYTTDPAKRWELCTVPYCSAYTYPTLAANDLSVAVTPEMISDAYGASTVGYCVNAASSDRVDKVQSDGLYSNDAEAPGVCYNYCKPLMNEPGFVGMQWRAMSGGARCVCYFDDGYVPTTLPVNSQTATTGTSVGPIVGSGMVKHFCYSYKGYMDASRVAIYGNTTSSPLTDYLNFNVYGTTLKVANAEKPYDQNQNHIGKISPTFDATTHSTLSAQGNTWSAYLLPEKVTIHQDTVLQLSFTLKEDTVDGFQAVCLDVDTEETGPNGKCFVLRSTQGWIGDMINVPTQTGINETTTHSIPVGDILLDGSSEVDINYLVFIQDSDGDWSKGLSEIKDLELVLVEDEHLEIEIDSQMQYLDNDQVSYKNNGNDNEDTKDYWMHLTEDHKSVQINGNQWKALPLNAPYSVNIGTLLEFDLVIDESVGFHAICLDADASRTNVKDGNECVVLQGTLNSANQLTTKLETSVAKKVVIPFGSFWNLKEGEVVSVSYLGFIQNNDNTATRHQGRSTYSNFRLYDEPRMPIQISLFGNNVTVPNVQDALMNNMNDVQDSRDHIMSVSAGGHTITATSNSWKLLTLPTAFMVTPATALKFDFALYEESELHAICLLDDIYIKDGRKDCFFTAGLQTPESTQGPVLDPYTVEGQTGSYDVMIGQYFTGEVKYLGILLDNDLGFTAGDVEQTQGQSSWSNIEVYNLPSLKVGLDSEVLEIENDQVSYKSASEDSTPIRDYMATISEDGNSINVVGNMWRALKVPDLLPSSLGDFVVSFDFSLDTAAEIHGLCFDENLRYGDQDNPANSEARRCVSTAFFQEKTDILDVLLTDHQTRVGESHRYVLNLSKMFDRLDTYATADTPVYAPKTLTRKGNNGSPAAAFPLGLCEGDCDNDGECAGSLRCFQRNALQPVTGCDSLGDANVDYCYDPDPYQPSIRYLSFVSDNDADRSVGDSTFSNIAITTSASSCLSNEDFQFQLNDCTVGNFLGKVEEAMVNKAECTSTDALIELFGMFGATQETDVYKQIEKICMEAYKTEQYDFTDATLGTDQATERQLVKEYIDGGTTLNYETEADSAVMIGKVDNKHAASRLLSWPKHHALDECSIGAAMCCFVGSRTSVSPVENNSDVCYVDMKASKRTAHVQDGWSIYGDSEQDLYCEGFAWGKDGGSLSSALKGNALFHVGFADNLFTKGNVEQIPGAPLCGCMDRMPVVTNAACTEVSAPGALVDVSFDSTLGAFDTTLTIGDIVYSECADDFATHYKLAAGVTEPDEAYIDTRIVGDGGCGGAISGFLAKKGLVKSA